MARHVEKAVVRQHRRAYREVFQSGQGKLVLADMAGACHAQSSTFVPGDPVMSAFEEGKRWVWIRIQNVLRMSEQDIDQVLEYARSRAPEE